LYIAFNKTEKTMLNDIQELPNSFQVIKEDTEASGFTMASDIATGTLLRTLAASKPGGDFLELGTGTGLSTSWLLDGMSADAKLTSIDNDERFLSIARKHLGHDPRLTLVSSDGGDWLSTNTGATYDYIFADTWHGKYLMLDEGLEMLKIGGLYIVDDMLPQDNWPEGHDEKAKALVRKLDQRKDLVVSKLHWATGIIICTKIH